MPKESMQKIKLLYLYDILLKETDENNCLSAQELIKRLEEKDIFVERKTIFSDIQTLKDFGLDIVVKKSRENSGYYLNSRDFELPELKIITEAILSSRFISAKKSKNLINRLSILVSPSERKQLEREVYVSGRVKTENESVYYNVDMLHNSMLENREITFYYLTWNPDKTLAPRKNGKLYRVSPWALTVKDENYYLIAYDDQAKQIKHYRVDKMKDIKTVGRSKRLGKEKFSVYDLGEYTNQNFGMFGGDNDVVSLSVPEDKVGIIFDRFGKDISIKPDKNHRYVMRVHVCVSSQFYGWLTGLGADIYITGPEQIKNEYVSYIENIIKSYKEK